MEHIYGIHTVDALLRREPERVAVLFVQGGGRPAAAGQIQETEVTPLGISPQL